MLRKICVVFLLVAFLSSEIHGKAIVRSGLKQCFKHTCPENTIGCSRHSKISEDRKEIVSEIKCVDLRSKPLETFTSSEPNQFGDGVFFEGYSYRAAYEYSNDDSYTGDEHNKDVETNIIDVGEKESEGNSEIDDLNRDPEEQ